MFFLKSFSDGKEIVNKKNIVHKKMQQQKQKMHQKEIGERIKSHVGKFVVSVILMKYTVLLYKNQVIYDSAILKESPSSHGFLNLLKEQTTPGSIDGENPLSSIDLSHKLINFIIDNFDHKFFITKLRSLCLGGSLNFSAMTKIMQSKVKPLKPYVNSVLKTINLPDKKTIDDIYEKSVTTDGDFSNFLDQIVLFADKIAKEVVSKRNVDLRTLPKPQPQILPQHKQQTHQKHGQHKPTHQTHGQHKQKTHQTHEQHKQHKPTHRNMNNKHHIHEEILAKIKHMLEGLMNMKKHHVQPQTTVSIPTNSEKARKLLGIQTDNKKTTVN